MRISIFTLFPAMFDQLNESILGRAQKKGIIEIELIDIRLYSDSKHGCADDYPFGGGAGMVMTPQPVFSAFESVFGDKRPYTVYMSPQGRVLTQDRIKEISKLDSLAVLCGHYEGVDNRILENLMNEEISIGDYVLTGGELPAMVLIDCVSRYIDGVLGSGESLESESHEGDLLEYPQYTRPNVFRGMNVPEVLLSGHHANIEKWKYEQRLITTAKKRPDLLEKAELSEDDIAFLKKESLI